MKNRLLQLDGIRALLCLSVVFSHWMGSRLGWTNFNFVNAYISVDGFFILSGFVLSFVYSKKVSNGEIGFVQFSLHRLARLYPLHILTMLMVFFIYAVLNRHIPFDDPIGTAVNNLLLLHGMGLEQSWSWNDPSWSVSVEFYASIVLFLCLLKYRNNYALIIIASIGYALVMAKNHNLMAAKDLNLYLFSSGFLKCISGMCIGVVIKNILESEGPKTSTRKTLFFQLVTIALVSCFIFTKKNIMSYDALAIIGISYIIYSSCAYDNIVSRVLSSKILSYLGKISFSIYLIHTPVMLIFDYFGLYNSNSFVISTLLFCSILTAASCITFHFFEFPSYKVLKAFIDRKVAAGKMLPGISRENVRP